MKMMKMMINTKNILKVLLIIFITACIVGFSFNYYISKPIEYKANICYKGRYLVQIEEDAPVYSKIKQLTCETNGNIIILEEMS